MARQRQTGRRVDLALLKAWIIFMLFMMNQNGGNAQEWFAKVGAHYGLPMFYEVCVDSIAKNRTFLPTAHPGIL